MPAGLVWSTDAPTGETAFWDWPQWPKVVKTLIRDLLAT
jgi:hypothetical protein